jgi:hypothetical protein
MAVTLVQVVTVVAQVEAAKVGRAVERAEAVTHRPPRRRRGSRGCWRTGWPRCAEVVELVEVVEVVLVLGWWRLLGGVRVVGAGVEVD